MWDFLQLHINKSLSLSLSPRYVLGHILFEKWTPYLGDKNHFLESMPRNHPYKSHLARYTSFQAPYQPQD